MDTCVKKYIVVCTKSMLDVKHNYSNNKKCLGIMLYIHTKQKQNKTKQITKKKHHIVLGFVQQTCKLLAAKKKKKCNSR